MRRFVLVTLIALVGTPAYAGGSGDPVVSVALVLAIVLASAKLLGHFAELVGQPAILGELLAGILLGVVGRGVAPLLDEVAHGPEMSLLAGLGVLLLLFEVGLESTVPQMLALGGSALRVAIAGVIAPMVLGFWVAVFLMPESSMYTKVFIGAMMSATSVGITAGVLKDLGRSQSREARLILGAAVLDDVFGLVVLAVVAGAIAAASAGHPLAISAIGIIALKALVFLGGSLWSGVRIAPVLFGAASRLRSPGALLATGLAFCFFLSWLAARFGLAPIVGAFAAGLVLEEVHSRDFVDRGERNLTDLIRPIVSFLAPVFFVQIGMLTDVSRWLDPQVAVLGLALTVAGIAGKAVSGFAAPDATEPLDRWAVGLGMVPRGEVLLFFANMGLGLSVAGVPVVEPQTYSAIVMMVILTTLVTPPALKWRLGRQAT